MGWIRSNREYVKEDRVLAMRLICFPYAGGSADFYGPLEKALDERFEVVKVEYPGHGSRRADSLKSSIIDIADDVYERVNEEYGLDSEYALFGYSMGTIVLLEFLNKAIHNGKAGLLQHIFVASHEPRSYRQVVGPDIDVTEEWVKKRVIELGSIPQGLYDNAPFWRMYLPLYMADFEAIFEYDLDALSLTVDAPITVMYSEEDDTIFDIDGWRRFCNESFDKYSFDGGHFFITDHYKEIAEIINECC